MFLLWAEDGRYLIGILAGVSGWFLRSLEYCSNFHLSVAYWVHVLMSAMKHQKGLVVVTEGVPASQCGVRVDNLPWYTQDCLPYTHMGPQFSWSDVAVINLPHPSRFPLPGVHRPSNLHQVLPHFHPRFFRGTNFLQLLVRWKSRSVAKLFPSGYGIWLPRSQVLFLLICAAPKSCRLSLCPPMADPTSHRNYIG